MVQSLCIEDGTFFSLLVYVYLHIQKHNLQFELQSEWLKKELINKGKNPSDQEYWYILYRFLIVNQILSTSFYYSPPPNPICIKIDWIWFNVNRIGVGDDICLFILIPIAYFLPRKQARLMEAYD